MATTSMNNPQKHAEQKMKTIVIFDLSLILFLPMVVCKPSS